MKRFKDIAAIFSLAALLFSCAESVEEVADTRRPITFSSSLGRPGEGSPSKAQSPEVFSPGDGIGVFACYSGPTAAGQSFDPNFMNNQLVKFNGSAWTYSPVKYWPTNGTLEFYGYFPYNESDEIRTDGSMLVTHKCITGLEPRYAAHTSVKAENGSLSGSGISDNGNLSLGFTPILNKVNFTAKAKDGLFDEVESEEYKDCRFLIREFRVWGFYSEAKGSISGNGDVTWQRKNSARIYTHNNPLDMTPYLDFRNTEEAVPGYEYNPDKGYDTDRAVVIEESLPSINIFGKSAYFIPMNGVLSGNNPGFEVVYVVLTSKHGENVYKESGIVTRTGSLREPFAGNNGLIRKIININLEFSIDGVTVTRNLVDYNYKPMF